MDTQPQQHWNYNEIFGLIIMVNSWLQFRAKNWVDQQPCCPEIAEPFQSD
jgi:hypothetical protein